MTPDFTWIGLPLPEQPNRSRAIIVKGLWNRLSGATAPAFSVIICSNNDEKFQRVTASYASVFSPTSYEIIRIDDARSLAEGYTRGMSRARGRYLIFSHDDIRLVTPDFASRLTGHLAKFDLVGVAGTTRLIGGAWFLAGDPYDYQLVTSPNRATGQLVIVGRGRGPLVIEKAQALDGLFIAVKAKVARGVQFDANVFDGFHLYDLDFTFRAYLKGYHAAICRDLFIIHDSHGSFDDQWTAYRARFERKFEGLLTIPLDPIRQAPISNWLLDEATLVDRRAVEGLCAIDRLKQLLPQ